MVRTCMAASAGAITTIGTKPPKKELVEELKYEDENNILEPSIIVADDLSQSETVQLNKENILPIRKNM